MGYSNNKELFKPFRITNKDGNVTIKSMDFNGMPLIELNIPKEELVNILDNDMDLTADEAKKIVQGIINPEDEEERVKTLRENLKSIKRKK